jgi:hypothetical protein
MKLPAMSLRTHLLLAWCLPLLVAGCEGPAGSPVAPHFKQFGALYEKYKQKRGKPPESTDELREWVKKLPKSEIETLGIEDLDRAFVSPRDQQPYVIVPAKKAGRGGRGGPARGVIAHEQTGVDGKRLVLMPRGYTVMEMDEERFRAAVPGTP